MPSAAPMPQRAPGRSVRTSLKRSTHRPTRPPGYFDGCPERNWFAAIEKSLVASATGPRVMTGNVQLYLASVGFAQGDSPTGWASTECERGCGSSGSPYTGKTRVALCQLFKNQTFSDNWWDRMSRKRDGISAAYLIGTTVRASQCLSFKKASMSGADPLGDVYCGVYKCDRRSHVKGEVLVKIPPKRTVFQAVSFGLHGKDHMAAEA